MENRSLTSLQKDHQLIKNKMDNLLEMRLNGEIDGDAFAIKKTELSQRQDEVMKKLDQLNQTNKDWGEQTDICLKLAVRAQRAWKIGSKPLKRELLKSLCSNVLLKDSQLEFELRKSFDVILGDSLKQGLNDDTENPLKFKFEILENQKNTVFSGDISE